MLHRSRYWVSTMSPTESVIPTRQPLRTIGQKSFRTRRRTGAARWRYALASLAACALVLPALGSEDGPAATATGPRPAAEAAAAVEAEAVPGIEVAVEAEGVPGTEAAVEAGPGEGAEATLEEVLGATVDPLDQIERQIEAEEFRPAIATLEERVDALETESHRFDGRLVRPLTLLGDAHAGMGEYETALDHYQRALHLSRVNAGLNSPEQVEIVYREADTFKALGDFQEANNREEYAYHVLNRAHDPMDEALLPGIYHLARWYERTSNVFAARALYEQAVQIIDAHDKLETSEAIPALQGIASSYRMERFPPYYLAELEQSEASVVTASSMRQPISINNFPAGEAALQRVIRIRQAEQEQNPVAVARAVLDLADWYTLFDKPRRAEPLYAHAWELMAEAESFDVVGFFAEPELLYFPAPGNPSPPPPEDRGERSTGYVEVAFDVTQDGYVRGLDTVASQPDGLMDFRVRKSLRLARYRPMLVDGVPVAKQAHTYRHEFPYYPEREGDPPPATASAGG